MLTGADAVAWKNLDMVMVVVEERNGASRFYVCLGDQKDPALLHSVDVAVLNDLKLPF